MTDQRSAVMMDAYNRWLGIPLAEGPAKRMMEKMFQALLNGLDAAAIAAADRAAWSTDMEAAKKLEIAIVWGPGMRTQVGACWHRGIWYLLNDDGYRIMRDNGDYEELNYAPTMWSLPAAPGERTP